MENIVSGLNTFDHSMSNLRQTTISNVETNLNKLLKHPVLYGLIAVLLVVYGPRLQPKLPPMVRNLFNNNIFRFMVILLIAYLSSKSLELSLIVAIAFCLIISYTTSQEVQEQFSTITEDFTTTQKTTPTTTTQQSAVKQTPSWSNQCSGAASITDQSCVDYCLSTNGLKDAKCKSHFPNHLVHLDCSNPTLTNEEKEDCLKLSCLRNKPTGLNSYCSLIQSVDPETASTESSE